MKFYDRVNEMQILQENEVQAERSAVFTVLMGRRRVGKTSLMETGLYTQVGNWWDRKGLNEIDMIALNEFDHTAVAAEIKRNPKKISMSDLQTKVDALPKSEFKQYQFELKGLSIEDM